MLFRLSCGLEMWVKKSAQPERAGVRLVSLNRGLTRLSYKACVPHLPIQKTKAYGLNEARVAPSCNAVFEH